MITPVESRVVELDLGVMPSPAGSGELLLVDEWSCRLVFVTSGGSGVGVATFKGCRQVLFGYPNDEAQPGHPLYPGRRVVLRLLRGARIRLGGQAAGAEPSRVSGLDTIRQAALSCRMP